MSVAADPLEAMLAKEASADHAQAARRGERLERLASRIVSDLAACGLLRPVTRDDARVQVFHLLADEIYPNAAVDIPTLRHDR